MELKKLRDPDKAREQKYLKGKTKYQHRNRKAAVENKRNWT